MYPEFYFNLIKIITQRSSEKYGVRKMESKVTQAACRGDNERGKKIFLQLRNHNFIFQKETIINGIF